MKWILAALLLPCLAYAGTMRLSVVCPSGTDSCVTIFTDSGEVYRPQVPISDLKRIVIMGRRFKDPADSLLGYIQASGAEGDTIGFDLYIQDQSMGSIKVWAEDDSGNVSCLAAEYVFAVPD